MNSFLAILKTIWQIAAAIPALLELMKQVQRGAVDAELRKREEAVAKKEAELKAMADKLKAAQEAGDAQKQEDALRDIVNNL